MFTETDIVDSMCQSAAVGLLVKINILIADRELPLLLSKQGLPMAGIQCDR